MFEDVLLTSSQSDEQFSVCLWDYTTTNVRKHYKNGGIVAPHCLDIIGKDYILSGELGKPLLHLWLLNSSEVSKNIRLVLPEPPTCLAICPENTYLAVGINCKLYIWHLSSGKLLSVQQKNYQSISCIKFSNIGNFLLVGGLDGMLLCYNLRDLVAVRNDFMVQTDLGKVEPLYVKNDHSMAIKDIHIGIFGRKSRFATVSTDKTCRIYNLSSGEQLLNLIFDNALTSVLFDSHFSKLYVGSEIGHIKQFNLKEPPKTLNHHFEEEEKSDLTFLGHSNRIVCMALNISETILASGSQDCYVFTWDVKNKQILKKIKHKSPITNIKFVLNYDNFSIENIKARIVVKGLERNIDTDLSKMFVSKLQLEDLEIDENEEYAVNNNQLYKIMIPNKNNL